VLFDSAHHGVGYDLLIFPSGERLALEEWIKRSVWFDVAVDVYASVRVNRLEPDETGLLRSILTSLEEIACHRPINRINRLTVRSEVPVRMEFSELLPPPLNLRARHFRDGPVENPRDRTDCPFIVEIEIE
jgi:hypothetical protein